MTITPDQVRQKMVGLPMRSIAFPDDAIAELLNAAIHAGLVVEPPAIAGRAYLLVTTAIADRLTDFARESGDAVATWSMIINTLLRIAEANKHWGAAAMRSAAPPDPIPTADELDAEADRIRLQQIETIFSSLADLRSRVDGLVGGAKGQAFRDVADRQRLDELEERVRQLDDDLDGNMADQVSRYEELKGRIEPIEKRLADTHLIKFIAGVEGPA